MSLELWNKVKTPPEWALKPIKGGRLSGKTDISPIWRCQVMTEIYGQCGIGWKYEKVKEWTVSGSDGQVMIFVDINLYVKENGQWSDPIPGNGGDFLIEKETNGLHSNDEAVKMATTDALGSAMKMLGVAADIYAGGNDNSKYGREHNTAKQPEQKGQSAQKEFECLDCKEKISEAEYNYSLKNYEKHLCRKCQGNYTKKKSA